MGGGGTLLATCRAIADPPAAFQASNNTSITVSTLTHKPSSNQYSATCSTAGMIVHRNSSYAEPSSLMDPSTTRLSSPYMAAVEIELFQQYRSDGESNDDEANPVTKHLQTEFITETMVFGDGFPGCMYIS